MKLDAFLIFFLQCKDRKRSEQVRQILGLICTLIAVILGKNGVKSLSITKFTKEVNLKGSISSYNIKKISKDKLSQNT